MYVCMPMYVCMYALFVCVCMMLCVQCVPIKSETRVCVCVMCVRVCASAWISLVYIRFNMQEYFLICH